MTSLCVLAVCTRYVRYTPAQNGLGHRYLTGAAGAQRDARRALQLFEQVRRAYLHRVRCAGRVLTQCVWARSRLLPAALMACTTQL